jgi:hypothetical protein
MYQMKRQDILLFQGEDDDATMARSRQRHTENQEYEEPEEEEEDDDAKFDKCMQTLPWLPTT